MNITRFTHSNKKQCKFARSDDCGAKSRRRHGGVEIIPSLKRTQCNFMVLLAVTEGAPSRTTTYSMVQKDYAPSLTTIGTLE